MPTIHSLQGISDYYMPNYIIQLFGLPGIWTQLIHLVFAGLGSYVLLRYIKINFISALFGAVMFLMTPYMNVCIVHGHGSQLMTAAYIPWICWALLKLSKNQNLKNLGLLGILLGFQLQRGHIQIAYYTWLIIGIFVLYKFFTELKYNLKFYYYLFGSSIAALLMSASIIWPGYIYSGYSVRGAEKGIQSLTYFTDWSFSFKEMITFIIPSFYGFGGKTYWGNVGVNVEGMEHAYPMTDFPNYLGIFVVIFIFYGLIKLYKDKTYIFFVTLSIFFLLLSMGKNFFLFELLFESMPFFNKFRAPMMALMVSQFGFTILAALGFHQFIKNLNDNKKQTLVIFTSTTGILILIFLMFKNLFSETTIQYYYQTLNISLKNQIEIFQPIVRDMVYSDINTLIFILLSISILSGLLLYSTIKNKTIYHILSIGVILFSIIDLYLVNSYIIDPKPIKINSGAEFSSIEYQEIEQSKIKKNNARKLMVSENNLMENYKDNDLEIIKILKNNGYMLNGSKMWNSKLVRLHLNTYKFPSYRILSQTGFPEAGGNWAAYFGYHDINGYHPAKLKNYHILFESNMNKIKNDKQYNENDEYYYYVNLLRLMNVKKLVNWNSTWNISDIKINSLNRAFFVNNLIQYNNNDELLEKIILPDFEPTELSYTKNDIPEFYPKDPESRINEKTSFWSPNKIEIDLNIKNHNHFIGLSEIYYPNWEITSHDIDIIQINGLLRGFIAPPGNYTIVMEFNHNDIKYATIISFFWSFELSGWVVYIILRRLWGHLLF